MKNKPFNWDKYMDEAPYSKVLEGMGSARLLIPTMFSPCKNNVYLKTEDLSFGAGDYEALERQKNSTEERFIECYKELRNSPSFDLIEEMYLLVDGIFTFHLSKFYNNIEIAQMSKNKHFGDILMYLNEKSDFSLKCCSRKAELLVLKKLCDK